MSTFPVRQSKPCFLIASVFSYCLSVFSYCLSYIPVKELEKSTLGSPTSRDLKSDKKNDQRKKIKFFLGNTCPTVAKHKCNKISSPFSPWCE